MGNLFFPLTVSSFIFERYYAALLFSQDLLILGGPVMNRSALRGALQFAAIMDKVSRAAAGGASFRALPQLFKLKKLSVGGPSLS